MAGFDFLVWQALTVFKWSERGDSLGFGAERNPNAWRRLGSRSWTEPCHAGTEGFRVSLREDIDFTPRGNGAWRGKGGKAEQSGGVLQQFTDIPASVGNKSRKSLSPLNVRNSGARPGEAALQFIPRC